MFYPSVGAFLKDLPNVVDVGSPLSAIFATYNSVHGFDSGVVNTGKNTLQVRIQSGGFSFSPAALALLGVAMMKSDYVLMHDLTENIRHGAERVQDRVVSLTVEPIESAGPLLVVVYAGYTAFKRAFEFARTIRANVPTAKIVVLTCDCDFASKERALHAAMDAGEITGYIKGAWCGGFGEMGELVEGLISFWPQ
jgi:hypothetical protein